MRKALVNIFYQVKTSLPEQGIRSLVEELIGQTAIKRPDQIEIVFCDLATITKLNLSHRGLNGPTDVLTFYLPGPLQRITNIFVCPEYAQRSAIQKEISLNQELLYLIGHGLKHSLGIHH